MTMMAMMISVYAIIPITTPRTFNLLAICEAAMASGILPAAYSESTYRMHEIILARKNVTLTFIEYAIATIPQHTQQNRKFMREKTM